MFIILWLFTVVAAFLPTPWNIAAVLAASLLGTAGLILYSYLVWRRDQERIPPAGTTAADD